MAATMLTQDHREVYKHLRDIGCCQRCSLRYIGERNSSSYKDVASCLKMRLLVDKETTDNGAESKKMKRNPCIVCLGLLEDYTTSIMVQKVADDVLMAIYDCDSFACAITLPICIQLRAHSVWSHLVEKFSMDELVQETFVTPLKEAWKWTVAPVIAAAIGKELDSGAVCDFFIEINMTYASENQECACLLEMHPETFKHRERQKRRYHGTVFTRKAVETALQGTETERFRKFVEVPPPVPAEAVVCNKVVCAHNPLYLAGRYNKFSRTLSQTPWLIEGERKMESSVQDLICEDLRLAVKAEGFKFSSSGREDVDVRMLGRGRPFVVELLNPRHVKLTRAEIRALERDINHGTQLIAVRDMQVIHKDELVHLKTGEELKVKRYKAVCTSRHAVTREALDRLEDFKDVVLSQRTPIRVLHRRPFATRSKTIHAMSASPMPGDGRLFKLDVATQAGTYVKEFVHGDFGRTKPSLGDLLGTEIDILALDVEEIELNWPPTVNYSEEP